jgi:hypothetical protein
MVEALAGFKGKEGGKMRIGLVADMSGKYWD